MTEFLLRSGEKVLIDSVFIPLMKAYKWRMNNGYVVRDYAIKDSTKKSGYKILKVLLHRVVAGAKDGEVVDHKNRNRCDNRKSNLRITTSSINSINRSIGKNNSSGETGVEWHKRDKVWQSRISINGKRVQLGYFDKRKDAVIAYRNKLKEVLNAVQ